ncbi:hypothetical protein BOTBODRAFT_504421 [Botryobasidium botryosum FD-172 SS1]|uniref:Secreted protein n=1 Tax=Botryobasidium botryosum (strain FD-172 SS1) TaxID=930990 RepID=A0A067M5P2_BOTB1|nr:hypothetical protein BOTBODRAFT_504421 [Botryobasidium botryosum FD-172 SS1]
MNCRLLSTAACLSLSMLFARNLNNGAITKWMEQVLHGLSASLEIYLSRTLHKSVFCPHCRHRQIPLTTPPSYLPMALPPTIRYIAACQAHIASTFGGPAPRSTNNQSYRSSSGNLTRGGLPYYLP